MGKGKKKRGRIKAGVIPTSPGQIPPASYPDDLIHFSFRYLAEHNSSKGKFCIEKQGSGYLLKLLERLKVLSECRVSEVLANRSKALRFHPIEWNDTTEPEGFTHLNEQLKATTPYQFTISANAHGRVHGFFIKNVFFIVWLDPEHNLYD